MNQLHEPAEDTVLARLGKNFDPVGEGPNEDRHIIARHQVGQRFELACRQAIATSDRLIVVGVKGMDFKMWAGRW